MRCRGWVFIITELFSCYADTVRFIEVEGIPVTNSDQHLPSKSIPVSMRLKSTRLLVCFTLTFN